MGENAIGGDPSGAWPFPESPSSTENNGILLDLHNNRGAMS